MSSNANADDGGNVQNNFSPEVLSEDNDAALAESVRSADPGTLAAVKEVMQETDAVLVRLDSTWWGNEAFGVWGEWFFIKPDSVSPSGKALFVDEGIKTSDSVSRVTSAKRMNETRGGFNSKAARKTRRKAFDWFDDSAKPGPGMPPNDDRDSFKNESVPLSVVRYAVRFPESDAHTVVETNGATHFGKMSEGDVRISGSKRDQYGSKLTLTGDTYELLSSNGEDLGSEMSWNNTHCTYDGDEWVMDRTPESVSEFVRVLTDNGYKVSIDEDFSDLLSDGSVSGGSSGCDGDLPDDMAVFDN